MAARMFLSVRGVLQHHVLPALFDYDRSLRSRVLKGTPPAAPRSSLFLLAVSRLRRTARQSKQTKHSQHRQAMTEQSCTQSNNTRTHAHTHANTHARQLSKHTHAHTQTHKRTNAPTHNDTCSHPNKTNETQRKATKQNRSNQTRPAAAAVVVHRPSSSSSSIVVVHRRHRRRRVCGSHSVASPSVVTHPPSVSQ